MYDKAEHRVAMHQLVGERRAAGQPAWAHTIDISDAWRNDALTFEERRDAIVRVVKASRWYRDRDRTGFDEFGDVVGHLATADDPKEFNGWWNELYDHADYDRVWIER